MVPFRTVLMPRMDGDPAPPAYLSHEHDLAKGGVDFEMEAYLQSEAMRENGDQAVRIVTTNARYLYWTFAQMVTHLSCGGTNLCPGDLLGSGTISGPEREMFGSLVEMTTLGNIPLELPNGETRTFLEDGDEVIFRARCVRDGFASIGFGECAGRILSALPV
jgi:fumarylacetoacetase